VIIGDVCGHGLDAVLLARHVLSAFRRSAVAVPALDQVAGEISRAIRPHLGEEDFVTAVVAQIAPGGELTMVNCGHHPPLLHHGAVLRPLAGQTAGPPLGPEDDFTAFTASWLPGDRLLLYTDGLVESRNQHGDFLPEDQIATALAAAGCDQALDALMTAAHRHTGGLGHDDMALLLLEYGTHPHSSANGHPRPGRVKTLASQQRLAAVTQRPSARSRHRPFRCCSSPTAGLADRRHGNSAPPRLQRLGDLPGVVPLRPGERQRHIPPPPGMLTRTAARFRHDYQVSHPTAAGDPEPITPCDCLGIDRFSAGPARGHRQ
jgi:sigma-B regulation protein RsbU (phosphoserine phosphatase)